MKRLPLSSPHVHSEFCDGRSGARQMVQAAISKGFVSLGISSHAVQDFDPDYCVVPEREQDYIDTIRALQNEYEKDIRLWLGMERDMLSIADRSRYEYVIGSVHYLPQGDHRVVVDGDAARLKEAIERCYQGSGAAFARHYYQLLGRYVRDYKPDIIGHFDLVMRHNQQHQLFDPEQPEVMATALEALEHCRQGCELMEVNTGALFRSGARSPYPALPLLRHWRAIGGQVILSSDCHEASGLDSGYEQGLQLMREAGYEQMLMLGTGQQLFELVSL